MPRIIIKKASMWTRLSRNIIGVPKGRGSKLNKGHEARKRANHISSHHISEKGKIPEQAQKVKAANR